MSVRGDMMAVALVVGAALLTMPVFAFSAAGRRPDPLESDARGSFVLGGFVRRWFYWFIGPLERTCLALGLGPLFFNLLGAGFGVVAGALFAVGSINLAGWAILAGGAADVLDGRIARARGLASPRGAFLDSTLDRFAEVGAFVGLAALMAGSARDVALVAAALGGSLLVSYARSRGESVGVVCKLGIMQRAERLLLLGFGAIFDPAVDALFGWPSGGLLRVVVVLIAVGTVGTAVFRTVWIARRAPAK